MNLVCAVLSITGNCGQACIAANYRLAFCLHAYSFADRKGVVGLLPGLRHKQVSGFH